jgi:hypothetical protein
MYKYGLQKCRRMTENRSQNKGLSEMVKGLTEKVVDVVRGEIVE